MTVFCTVLPGWQQHFSQVFSELASDDDFFLLGDFDFWELISPFTTKRQLFYLINRYIAASREIKDPMFVTFEAEEVNRRRESGCVVQKGPLPEGAQPVGEDNDTAPDEHFFHICPYCDECDDNSRRDVVSHHLMASHKRYRSQNSTAMIRQVTHLERITRPVLLRIIKSRRALINAYRMHSFWARTDLQRMRGWDIEPPFQLLDENGTDLDGVESQRELAEISHREVRVLDCRDWNEYICRENSLAWDEAERQNLGFKNLVRDFDVPMEFP